MGFFDNIKNFFSGKKKEDEKLPNMGFYDKDPYAQSAKNPTPNVTSRNPFKSEGEELFFDVTSGRVDKKTFNTLSQDWQRKYFQYGVDSGQLKWDDIPANTKSRLEIMTPYREDNMYISENKYISDGSYKPEHFKAVSQPSTMEEDKAKYQQAVLNSARDKALETVKSQSPTSGGSTGSTDAFGSALNKLDPNKKESLYKSYSSLPEPELKATSGMVGDKTFSFKSFEKFKNDKEKSYDPINLRFNEEGKINTKDMSYIGGMTTQDFTEMQNRTGLKASEKEALDNEASTEIANSGFKLNKEISSALKNNTYWRSFSNGNSKEWTPDQGFDPNVTDSQRAKGLTEYYGGASDDPTWKDVTVGAFKANKMEFDYMEERYKQIMGQPNKADEMKAQLEAEGNDMMIDSSDFKNPNSINGLVGRGMANFMGQVALWTGGSLQSVGGAVAGAGIAIGVGQLGPQIAVPEEIVSVPWMAIKGYQAGSAKYIYQIETASAYDNMIAQGVDPEIAKKTAVGVGIINAGLEMAEIGTIAKSIPGVKQAIATAKNEALETTVKSLTKDYLKTAVIETGQEITQEIVGIYGENISKSIDNKVNGKELQTDFNLFSQQNFGRLLDTGTEMMLGMLVGGGLTYGPNVGFTAVNNAQNKKYTAKQQTDMYADVKTNVDALYMNASSDPSLLKGKAPVKLTYYKQFLDKLTEQGMIKDETGKNDIVNKIDHLLYLAQNVGKIAPDEVQAETPGAQAEVLDTQTPAPEAEVVNSEITQEEIPNSEILATETPETEPVLDTTAPALDTAPEEIATETPEATTETKEVATETAPSDFFGDSDTAVTEAGDQIDIAEDYDGGFVFTHKDPEGSIIETSETFETPEEAKAGANIYVAGISKTTPAEPVVETAQTEATPVTPGEGITAVQGASSTDTSIGTENVSNGEYTAPVQTTKTRAPKSTEETTPSPKEVSPAHIPDQVDGHVTVKGIELIPSSKTVSETTRADHPSGEQAGKGYHAKVSYNNGKIRVSGVTLGTKTDDFEIDVEDYMDESGTGNVSYRQRKILDAIRPANSNTYEAVKNKKGKFQIKVTNTNTGTDHIINTEYDTAEQAERKIDGLKQSDNAWGDQNEAIIRAINKLLGIDGTSATDTETRIKEGRDKAKERAKSAVDTDTNVGNKPDSKTDSTETAETAKEPATETKPAEVIDSEPDSKTTAKQPETGTNKNGDNAKEVIPEVNEMETKLANTMLEAVRKGYQETLMSMRIKNGPALDINVEFVKEIAGEITDAMLLDHGITSKDNAYIAGKNTIYTDHEGFIQSAIQIATNGEPVTQEIVHEFAELWVHLYQATEEYPAVEKALMNDYNKKMTSEEVREMLVELFTDKYLEKYVATENVDSGLLREIFGKFKNALASIIKRLYYYKEMVFDKLPPAVQRQAESFASGHHAHWGQLFYDYKRATKGKESSTSVRYAVENKAVNSVTGKELDEMAKAEEFYNVEEAIDEEYTYSELQRFEFLELPIWGNFNSYRYGAYRAYAKLKGYDFFQIEAREEPKYDFMSKGEYIRTKSIQEGIPTDPDADFPTPAQIRKYGLEHQDKYPNADGNEMMNSPQTVNADKELTDEVTAKTIAHMKDYKRYPEYEMVDTELMLKYREFDRTFTGHNSKEYLAELKASIRENGFKEPIMLMYDVNTGYAYVGEGNHRLMIARELGISKIPVVVIRESYSAVKGNLRNGIYLNKTVIETKDGSMPSSFSPSQVIPELAGNKRYEVASYKVSEVKSKKLFKAERRSGDRVGKHIYNDLYIHKSAIDTLTDKQQAVIGTALKNVPESFGDYAILKVNMKDDSVTFIKSPDWDTAKEPVVGDSIKVLADGSFNIRKARSVNPQIYHHKWLFVKDNYKGFDVVESKAWSEEWKNSDLDLDLSKIGNQTYWEKATAPLADGIYEAETYDNRVDKTSLNQTPAVITQGIKKGFFKEGTLNLDIGGGKYEKGTNALREAGVGNMVFDLFNRDYEYNKNVIEYANKNPIDTVTVANVLNVISDIFDREGVIAQASAYVKKDGTAYFQIYEGNKSGVGAKSSTGTWQNNMKTSEYIMEIEKYFKDVKRSGLVVIAKGPIKNSITREVLDLQDRQWELIDGKLTRTDKKVGTKVTRFSVKEKAPALYSQLEKVVTDKFPRRMPAKDAIGFLRRADNKIRKDEFEWTGIIPYLESMDSGMVTRQELLDFIANSRLEVTIDRRSAKGESNKFDTVTSAKESVERSLEKFLSNKGIKPEKMPEDSTLEKDGQYCYDHPNTYTNIISTNSHSNVIVRYEGKIYSVAFVKEESQEVLSRPRDTVTGVKYKDLMRSMKNPAVKDVIFGLVKKALSGTGIEDFQIVEHDSYKSATPPGDVILYSVYEKYVSFSIMAKEDSFLYSVPVASVDLNLGSLYVRGVVGDPREISVRVGYDEDEISILPTDEVKYDTNDYSRYPNYKYSEILYIQPDNKFTMEGHWGKEVGVLAHARVSVVADTDGNSVLYVDEIQSDIHQKGRVKGYQPSKNVNDAHETFSYFLDILSDVAVNMLSRPKQALLTEYRDMLEVGPVDYFNALSEKTGNSVDDIEDVMFLSKLSKDVPLNRIIEYVNSKFYDKTIGEQMDVYQQGVPDAPFKSSWYQFVIKNLIRDAVEKGYDAVVFTSGLDQINRWGKTAVGLATWYDGAVMDFVSKYIKQWDAVLTPITLAETGNADSNLRNGFYITPKMRDSVLYEGQPLFSVKENGVDAILARYKDVFGDQTDLKKVLIDTILADDKIQDMFNNSDEQNQKIFIDKRVKDAYSEMFKWLTNNNKMNSDNLAKLDNLGKELEAISEEVTNLLRQAVPVSDPGNALGFRDSLIEKLLNLEELKENSKSKTEHAFIKWIKSWPFMKHYGITRNEYLQKYQDTDNISQAMLEISYAFQDMDNIIQEVIDRLREGVNNEQTNIGTVGGSEDQVSSGIRATEVSSTDGAGDTGTGSGRPGTGSTIENGGHAGVGGSTVSSTNGSHNNRSNVRSGDTNGTGRIDLHIENDKAIPQVGEQTRVKNNIKAIELIAKLDKEGRLATAEEQNQLLQYVGWGGLSGIFDDRNESFASDRKKLKALLSPEEYASARASVNSAFYTPIAVIQAIYKGVEHFGYKGGRILDPSTGTGHFIGAMPANLKDMTTSVTGIEYDVLTAKIAKHLYQNQDIRHMGFQDLQIPDGFYDLVISNIPFASANMFDKKYPAFMQKRLENYFIAKALDKVKPGGLVVFLTSTTFMDNYSYKGARAYASERADLVGALRLPNTIFKGNANTAVTSDILIFRKKDGSNKVESNQFLESNDTLIDGNRFNVNEYFTKNKKNVLGKPASTSSRWDATYTVNPSGRTPIAEKIETALLEMQGDIINYDYSIADDTAVIETLLDEQMPEAEMLREGNFGLKDGKLYRKMDGVLVPAEKLTSKGAESTATKRTKAMIPLRNVLRELIRAQLQDKEHAEVDELRIKLNEAYDKFVKENGRIGDRGNVMAFGEDADFPLLASIEKEKDGEYSKGDIFKVDVLRPLKKPTSADTVSDAVNISLNEFGSLRISRIAELTGLGKEEIESDLEKIAFRNPNNPDVWHTEEEYLSGRVKAKLETAKAVYRAGDKRYKKNVEALEAVIPKPVTFDQIHVTLGSTLITGDIYKRFVEEVFDVASWGEAKIKFIQALGEWSIDITGVGYAMEQDVYGTKYKTATDLFTRLMNNKGIFVNSTNLSKIQNRTETLNALAKAELIRTKFEEWIKSTPSIVEKLTNDYNETYRDYVLRNYDGTHLTFSGMNPNIKLMDHQKNAVWRTIVDGGNTLLAHSVGAGKTFEMIATSMELKRLGKIKKPMFVVPNHLVEQWAKDFKLLYPGANILVATKKDLEKGNRRKFTGLIATSNFDAVIVAESAFGKIPMSEGFMKDFLEREINNLRNALEQAKAEEVTNGGGGFGRRGSTIKQIEDRIKKLEAQLEKFLAGLNQDDVLPLDEIGIDGLFVDEAHRFKNLYYTTSYTGVSGLGNPSGSQKAFDLFAKVKFLQQSNGGTGVVFATGTPISNTMAELYIMQRYLKEDWLEEKGLTSFDLWSKVFAKIKNSISPKIEGGGFQMTRMITDFINLGDMAISIRSFMDILTRKDLEEIFKNDPDKVDLPVLKNGSREIVVAPASDALKEFIKELAVRAEAIKGGGVDPADDNMLKISSEGRKASLDMRMLDPDLEDNPDSKINRAVFNISEIWRDTEADRSTQVVFLDMGIPKARLDAKKVESDSSEFDTDDNWSVYEDIRQKLIARGIPKEDIALMHDAKNIKQKQEIFDGVNSGKIRILIGSTEKMGVGMNVQKKLVALHHLDPTWRPSDIEQREGRIIRQGNENREVQILTYVTEGSFDVYMWNKISNKASMVDQALTADFELRTLQDLGEMALSASEIMAFASGDETLLELTALRQELEALGLEKDNYLRSKEKAKGKITSIPKRILKYNEWLGILKKEAKTVVDTSGENFKITINGKEYTDRKEAGQELIKIGKDYAQNIQKKISDDFYGLKIGKIGGKDLYMKDTGGIVFMTNTGLHDDIVVKTQISDSDIGVIRGVENQLKRYDERIKTLDQWIAEQEKELATYHDILEKEFPKEALYQEKLRRKEEIDGIMASKAEEDLSTDADGKQANGETTNGDYDEDYDEDMDDNDRYLKAERDFAYGARAFEPIPRSIEPIETGKKAKKAKPIQAIILELKRKFKITVNHERFPKGKKALGFFRVRDESIWLKHSNDMAVLAHEIGHMFDKKYDIENNNYALVNNMVSNLEQRFFDAYEAQELPGEAIAEFMARYMINDAYARDFGGAFYDEFEKMISKEDMKILKQARSDISAWYSQSIRERIESTNVTKVDKPEVPMNDKARLYYMDWFNNLLPFREFRDKLKAEHGNAFDAIYDPYAHAINARLSNATTAFIITERMVDTKGDVIGDGFKSIFKGIKNKDYEAFNAYLKAKHSLSRDKVNKPVFEPGISKRDAVQAVASYELTNPEFVEASTKLYEWWRTFSKAWLVDTGLVAPEMLAKWQEMYPFYVPLMRSKDYQGYTLKKRKGGSGYDMIQNPVRRAKGGHEQTYMPIENFISQIGLFVDTVKKREVMVSMVEASDRFSGMGYFLTEVSAKQRPESVSTWGIKYDVAMKLGEKIIKKMTRDEKDQFYKLSPDKQIEALIKLDSEKMIEAVDNIIGDSITKWVTIDKDGEDDIIGVVDRYGNLRHFKVEDKLTLMAILNLNQPEVGFVVEAIGLATTIFKKFTVANPVFALTRNLPRDLQQGYVNSEVNNLGKYAVEILKSYFDVLTNSETYRQYKQMGGYSSSVFTEDRDMMHEILMDIVPGYATRSPLNAVKTVIGYMHKLEDTIEAGPRLVEFRRYAGKDYHERVKGMEKALDVTLNFRTWGSKGYVLNKIVPFFNAALLELDKLYRGYISEKEGRAERWAKSLATYTLGILAMMALVYGDDPDYDELPSFVKDRYILFKMGDGWISIPLPQGIGTIFATFPKRIYEDFVLGKPDAWKGFTSTIMDTLLPQVRPIFLPALETAYNKSWYGGDVVHGSYNYLPSVMQADEKTSGVAKGIAGATQWLPDNIYTDIIQSPMKLDYFLKAYGGPLAKMALESTSESGKVDNAVTKNTIGRMYVGNDEYSKTSTSDYYDITQELTEAYNMADKNIGQMEPTQRTAYMYVFGSGKTKGYADAVDSLSEQISKIKKSDLSAETKKTYIDDLERRKEEAMKQTVDIYNQNMQ